MSRKCKIPLSSNIVCRFLFCDCHFLWCFYYLDGQTNNVIMKWLHPTSIIVGQTHIISPFSFLHLNSNVFWLYTLIHVKIFHFRHFLLNKLELKCEVIRDPSWYVFSHFCHISISLIKIIFSRLLWIISFLFQSKQICFIKIKVLVITSGMMVRWQLCAHV